MTARYGGLRIQPQHSGSPAASPSAAGRIVAPELLLRSVGLLPMPLPVCNTKGYSSTYLAMGFANVRAGTWHPPGH